MREFEILWELPKCDTETQWASVVGEMAPISLFYATNVQCVKTKKNYLWSTIKQNTLQWDVPDFYNHVL